MSEKIALFIFLSCIFLSCKNGFSGIKTNSAEYKSISALLQDAKKQNIHNDKSVSIAFMELLSKRGAKEILSLTKNEKDEVLRISITASLDIKTIIKFIEKYLKNGEMPKKTKFRKDILSSINKDVNLKAVKVILSNDEYLKSGELESIIFNMVLILSQDIDVLEYEKIEKMLKDENNKDIIKTISSLHLEMLFYSYKVLYEREDINAEILKGVKFIDLLPEIKVSL